MLLITCRRLLFGIHLSKCGENCWFTWSSEIEVITVLAGPAVEGDAQRHLTIEAGAAPEMKKIATGS
jgi:hypothetical protein